MERGDIQALAKLIEQDPEMLITLDLLEGKVTAADMDFKATLPDHAREAAGEWEVGRDRGFARGER